MHPTEAAAANWAKSFSWLVEAVIGGGGAIGGGGVAAGEGDLLTGSGALANPAVGLFDFACFNFFFLDLLFEAVPAPNPLPSNDVDVR